MANAERTFGFEIESMIDHVDKTVAVFPSIDVRDLCDVELGSDTLATESEETLAYTTLYVFDKNHLEIISEPFVGEENLLPFLSQGYDAARDIPTSYQPWFTYKYTSIEGEGYKYLEVPVNPNDCVIKIGAIDVSCGTDLHEVGLEKDALSEPAPREGFDGQWEFSYLGYSNRNLRQALKDTQPGIDKVTAHLRKKGDLYILHTKFTFEDRIKTDKAATLSGVVDSMSSIAATLTSGGTTRTFALGGL